MLKIRKTPTIIISTIISALVIFIVGSFFLGYRYFFVETPSMGTAAPVGSLVVSKDKSQYSKDDIVAFHRSGNIYVHRIVKQNADGSFTTKGDLNAFEDSTPLYHGNIIGSSVFIGKHLGWVWRGLPMFIIGMIIVYLISIIKRIDEPWRWPIRTVGYSIVVTVITFFLNPWMGAQMLGYLPSANGNGVDMRIVNTGIFPIRDEKGGRFYSGEDRIIHVEHLDGLGRYFYVPKPSLGFWGIVFLAIWCLIPLFVALVVHIPDSRYAHELTKKELSNEKKKNFVLFFLIIMASLIILVINLSAFAGFTATVVNSSNNTRTQSRCTWAYGRVGRPRSLFSYALGGVNGRGAYSNQGGSGAGTAQVFEGSVDNSRPMACAYQSGTALKYNGLSTCVEVPDTFTNPSNFSYLVWFKTTEKPGAVLVRFGDNKGDSSKKDRLTYIDKDGRLVFGLYGDNTVRTVSSGQGIDYADGLWHMLVVTMSPRDGTRMYVDGKLAGSESEMRSGENFSGSWTIGCGSMRGWRHADGSGYDGTASQHYNGSMKDFAYYNGILTPEQVYERYLLGKVVK